MCHLFCKIKCTVWTYNPLIHNHTKSHRRRSPCVIKQASLLHSGKHKDPDSKGPQDPGGPHVGPMNLAIRGFILKQMLGNGKFVFHIEIKMVGTLRNWGYDTAYVQSFEIDFICLFLNIKHFYRTVILFHIYLIMWFLCFMLMKW